MQKRLLKIVAVTFALGLVAPAAVLAQAPPMDMSWAIRSQQRNWAVGQAAAAATAMRYLRTMQQLRAMGYTGPSLPTGVTAESLRNSINAANQAGIDYNHAQMLNSQRRSNAVADYDLRAIRGCSYALDQYGRLVCVR
ncbi:MAG TPA: hypothetical protein VMG60_16440 [Burkholderiaceae bacterium]|nr:hypothetical protein [Burkholderiaceae bacterium]